MALSWRRLFLLSLLVGLLSGFAGVGFHFLVEGVETRVLERLAPGPGEGGLGAWLLPQVARLLATGRPVPLDEGGNTFLVRLTLPKDHPWVGHTLAELRLPPGVLVASVLRQGTTLVPRGETRLRAQDQVVLLGTPEGLKEAADLPLKFST
ncbi:TrkA C-terminal domain-containing protein [Thermus composti]|uniref:TrkA C-terminal domain-containing protein n=1 Tax=Thermus composti TaxID=532059 RepID=A0ABV6Q0P4_9DEIN|nr:TrkA C-terminal domain-containing protein [Thermus composti]